MKIMKKILMLFFINLLIPIAGFSQSTSYPKIIQDTLIVITNNQLKATNLIFLEHRKFQQEIVLKDSVIFQQNAIIKNNNYIDSLRSNQIQNCISTISSQYKTIETLQNKIKSSSKKNKRYLGLTIGGFSLSAVLGALLLLR